MGAAALFPAVMRAACCDRVWCHGVFWRRFFAACGRSAGHRRSFSAKSRQIATETPLPQGLIKILDQIVRILEADRQSQETFRLSCSGALNRRSMLDQAFYATQTSRASKDFRLRRNRHRRVTAIFNFEGEHSAEQLVRSLSRTDRHLAPGDFVSGMRAQSRIMYARNFSMLGQKFCDFHRVFRMRPHPPRQGAHPAQNQPAIERRGDCAARILDAANTLKELAILFYNDDSAGYVAMPTEILRCRMQN